MGKEKIALNFSDEDQPQSDFIFSNGRTGKVQLLAFEALVQIDDESPIQLQCGSLIPGMCR